MKKQKALYIVGAVLAVLTIIACDAGKGGTPQPPANPPAAGGGGAPLVHPLILKITAYDCHPDVNPGGGCNVALKAGDYNHFATITVMAQTPNGSTPQVVNKTTGKAVDTCEFIGDSTGVPCYTYNTVMPWTEEQDIQDGMVYMVWKIRVSRVPPLMRVHCDLYSITDMTNPIVQLGNVNDYENYGPDLTTTGDIACGWPIGWTSHLKL